MCKGALFVCMVDRANAITANDVHISNHSETVTIGGSFVDRYLKDLFADNQLELIEIAFEGQAFETNLNTNNTEQAKQDAKMFFRLFGWDRTEDTETRLRAILENIVVNKGTFKPEIQPIQKRVTEGFRG